jgi:putative transposase
MRIKQPVPSAALRLARKPPVELSAEAKERLRWLEWHQRAGKETTVKKTCHLFQISRSTFYNWRRRYDPKNLRSLEDRSSRPKRARQRSWGVETVKAVQRLREKYPRWGKDKLAVLLRQDNIKASVSTVGRVINYLKATGQLVEPARSRRKLSKKARARIYAVRKPKDYGAKVPGDIVQIDTMDVYPWPGLHLKHFSLEDVISRINCLELRGRATAKITAEVLEDALARFPFEVKALQIDGGSEWKAEFEAACQKLGILLFVLPPRSPKLNGCVERAHRTHQEEFYEVTDCEPTLEDLRAALREWEHTYNAVRPHQALGYKTPLDYLKETGHYKPKEEGVRGR